MKKELIDFNLKVHELLKEEIFSDLSKIEVYFTDSETNGKYFSASIHFQSYFENIDRQMLLPIVFNYVGKMNFFGFDKVFTNDDEYDCDGELITKTEDVFSHYALYFSVDI